jgi:hypothetical protein
MPSKTTGPENAPDATISRATLAPMLNPTATLHSMAAFSILKSSGGGVPPCPGSVAATK